MHQRGIAQVVSPVEARVQAGKVTCGNRGRVQPRSLVFDRVHQVWGLNQLNRVLSTPQDKTLSVC